jgi:hypothetical protein
MTGISRTMTFLDEKWIMKPVSTRPSRNVARFFTKKSKSPSGESTIFLLSETMNSQLAKNRDTLISFDRFIWWPLFFVVSKSFIGLFWFIFMHNGPGEELAHGFGV